MIYIMLNFIISQHYVIKLSAFFVFLSAVFDSFRYFCLIQAWYFYLGFGIITTAVFADLTATPSCKTFACQKSHRFCSLSTGNFSRPTN